MTLIEVMTLITLFGCAGVFVLKMWNIINILVYKEKGMEKAWLFLSWGAYLVFWLFSLQILVNDPATNPAVNSLYLLNFNILTIFLAITTMLLILELLLSFDTDVGKVLSGKQTVYNPPFYPRL